MRNSTLPSSGSDYNNRPSDHPPGYFNKKKKVKKPSKSIRTKNKKGSK